MTPKDRHLLRMLREDGTTIDRLAKGFGMTKQAISWHLNYQPHPRPFLTADERRERARKWDRTTYRRKCGLVK